MSIENPSGSKPAKAEKEGEDGVDSSWVDLAENGSTEAKVEAPAEVAPALNPERQAEQAAQDTAELAAVHEKLGIPPPETVAKAERTVVEGDTDEEKARWAEGRISFALDDGFELRDSDFAAIAKIDSAEQEAMAARFFDQQIGKGEMPLARGGLGAPYRVYESLKNTPWGNKFKQLESERLQKYGYSAIS